ncbi:tetrahydromethanopterin S-methyltransferase subunit A [Methanosphaera sp. WGK6]|uniref:tetrahydromethanopterin S-methyltransferase subunit A n=1 Tax=Methanosphaera sp. WGK6 TaxID=1561964 RepID=UPI00084BF5B2|nr:tetrahydromethanopterin S-methyltransferase subunit A [Methanosphaera sp. WGK6]OED30227.1 tetrahydromethanopterin S-methyltransferase subunit A [Methanosphaera sp. WGK6]
MVDKKEVIQGWPLETGDYSVGDETSPVAVVSLGSNMNEDLVNAGAAISGPLHTENLGIEKVVANVISNSNIRYVLICGSEVQGHITGKTVEALYENGIDAEKKSIIGSPGAIPFVENLPIEAVGRFQEQVSIISMINNENIDELSEKIKECLDNDPGAYDEEAMIVELNESEEEDVESTDDEIETPISGESVDTISLNLLAIENRIRLMQDEIKQIASQEKISSGYYAGKIEGIVIGFILTIILVLIVVSGM